MVRFGGHVVPLLTRVVVSCIVLLLEMMCFETNISYQISIINKDFKKLIGTSIVSRSSTLVVPIFKIAQSFVIT